MPLASVLPVAVLRFLPRNFSGTNFTSAPASGSPLCVTLQPSDIRPSLESCQALIRAAIFSAVISPLPLRSILSMAAFSPGHLSNSSPLILPS